MERNKPMRKWEEKLSTRAIEVRLPKVLYDLVCNYKRMCGWNGQRTIREILQDFFKDELRGKIREAADIETG